MSRSLGWPGKLQHPSRFLFYPDHLARVNKITTFLYMIKVYYHKRLIHLKEVCLHSTVLEATLGHDSGREETWRFWVQWDISS